MSLLLNTQEVSKSFGSRSLFENLSLSLFAGNRVGLIGPNGVGKSTLLKILAGLETPDSGTLAVKRDLKIGYVAQSQDFPDCPPLSLIQEQTSSNHLAEMWLSKLGFKGEERSAAELSGGWKKRLAIALELAKEPDLLLLDEPTNHLDLEAVVWLENFLLREVPTFVLVSHDRAFLQKMTNRTVEINRAYPEGIFSIEGNFEQFTQKKREFLEGQLQKERSVATKVRKETEWLRQTPKARTSKSQARIDQASEIFAEHSDLKERNAEVQAKIEFVSSQKKTRKLLVAKNLAFEPLFRHLDITLSPGTRLGLVGSNGCGKTTLLRLLAQEMEPSQGTIKQADSLKIVYFDQHRAKLPLDLTLREALSPSGDYVNFRGSAIHVNGWCKRFLFSPDLLGMPIKALSGGERARITIAHLMLQPADILLLDEPTNDLDIPTLETLEENLISFPGAVVLITHDRCLLERCCTKFLSVKEGKFFSELKEWSEEPKKTLPSPKKPPAFSPKKRSEGKKIEKKIDQAETHLASLKEQLETDDVEKLQALCQEIAELESDIESHYLAWAEANEI